MLSTSAGSLQDLHNSYSFMENLPNPRKATNMYTVNIWRLRADLRVRNNKPDVLEIVKNDIFSQQRILYNTFVLWLPWIIERLDRKLADAIGSNIMEKCDITLSRAIQPLTSDVLRVLFFLAYFTISQYSTVQIAHVLK